MYNKYIPQQSAVWCNYELKILLSLNADQYIWSLVSVWKIVKIKLFLINIAPS